MPTAAQPDLVFRDPAAEPSGLSVQPHGAVLVVGGTGLRIEHAGGALERLIGLPADRVLGRALVDVFGRQAEDWLVQSRPGPHACRVGRWRPEGTQDGQACDVLARQAGERWALELEPASLIEQDSPQLVRLARAMDSLRAATDTRQLCAVAARELRQLTGFERVLVLQFPEEGGVCALAEDRDSRVPSLLGALDSQSWPYVPRHAAKDPPVEFIADVSSVPQPLLTADSAGDGAALLQGCALHGAAAPLRWKLRALGVGSSLTLAWGDHGQPRGLLVAHRSDAHHPGHPLREAGRLLAQAFDQHMRILGGSATQPRGEKATTARHRALERVRSSLAEHVDDSLDHATLDGLVPADGVAVVCGQRVRRWGHAPSTPQLHRLVIWLRTHQVGKVHASRRLASTFAPPSPDHVAVGVLACTSAGEDPLTVLWFRRTDDAAAGRGHHPPSELARAQTPLWSSSDIDAAQQLAWALDAWSQQRTQAGLNAQLRDRLAEQQALVAQKHLLTQEAHHRTQNGLQIVNAMLQLQARQASDPSVRAQLDAAVGRLRAVSAVHRHLWQSDDALNVPLHGYLEQLCADLIESWEGGWAEHFQLTVANVSVPGGPAATLGLIVTELLTNAVKYAYGGKPGPLQLRVDTTRNVALQLTVSDQGRGIGTGHGHGLGSELIRIFTAQLGGTQCVSGDGGTTVTIRVPMPAPLDDTQVIASSTGEQAEAHI